MPLYFQFGIEIFPEFDLVAHPQGFCYAEVRNSFSYDARGKFFLQSIKNVFDFYYTKNPEFIAECHIFPGRNYVVDMRRNFQDY